MKDRTQNLARNFIRGMAAPLKRPLARLAGDERGVSAVEFAMLLPLMLTLYLGAVEISQGIGADRKVTLTARTVADLASQASSLAAQPDDQFAERRDRRHRAVLRCQPQGHGVAGEDRRQQQGDDRLEPNQERHRAAQGSSVTLPAALVVANSCLVWSEVQYTYKPTVGYVVSGTLTLKDQIYMRPRLSDCVTYPAT